MSADAVRQCFNDSFLKLFFPALDNAEGQEYLLLLSQYALDCAGGQAIAEKCPDIFCCWASHYVAWLLATWGKASVTETGVVNLHGDPSAFQPALYLKSKEVGGKKCTWEQVKDACSGCDNSHAKQWGDKWRELAECCLMPEPFITAGSFMPKQRCCTSCCGADFWAY